MPQHPFDGALDRYVRRGYIVQSRGEFDAQLIYRKRFRLIFFLLLLLCGLFPGVIYLFWFLFVTRDTTLYLRWDGEKVIRVKR